MGWRILERLAYRPEWQLVLGLGYTLVGGLFVMAVARRALHRH